MEYTPDRGRHLRAGRALQIGEVPVLLQIIAFRYDTNSIRLPCIKTYKRHSLFLPRWLPWRRRSPTSQSLGTCSTIVRTVPRLSMTGFGLFLFSSVQHSRSQQGLLVFTCCPSSVKHPSRFTHLIFVNLGTPPHYLHA